MRRLVPGPKRRETTVETVCYGPGVDLDVTVDRPRSGSAELQRAGETTGRSASGSVDPGEVPERIGRYTVRGVLGHGGMGIVYAALDPAMNRPVAVKVLLAPCNERHRKRLRAEARALALLDHPNILRIYDVGEHDERLFMAMELVDGPTLAQWQSEGGRTVAEIVAMYVQAARGLAAAHAASLVHRDFKPRNVLVGRDGRARVLDFGLVQQYDAAARIDTLYALDNVLESEENSADEAITTTGAFLGTPAYMAPEQFAGQPVTPATDQFSFCVALYEALSGRAPFQGEDWRDRATSVFAETPRPLPADRSIPRGLDPIVRRGLAIHPRDRWPSMDALVTALEAGRRRPRRLTTWGASMLGAGMLAGGFASASWIERHPDVASPSDRAAIVDEGGPEVQRLGEALDRWERALEAGDLGTARRRRELAEAAAAGIDAPRWRAASTYLTGEHELAEGRYDASEQAMAEAYHLGLQAQDDALAARAAGRLARIVGALLRRSAEAQRWRAAAEALESRAPLSVGQRTELLVDVAAALMAEGELDRAEALLKRALEVSRGHDAAPEREAIAVFHQLGQLANARGDSSAAAPHFERALALSRQVLSEAHCDTAAAMSSLGQHVYRSGDVERARELFERSFAIREAALPPDHPHLGSSHLELGTLARRHGDHERAREHYERAKAIYEGAYGPEHPTVSLALVNLGTVDFEQRAFDAALQHFMRALTIRQTSLGPDDVSTATALEHVGATYQALGQLDEARSYFERALQSYRRTAPDHVGHAHVLFNLATLEIEAGEFDRALAHATRAVQRHEDRLGAEHPELARSLVARAMAHRKLGQFDAALDDLGRAETIFATRYGEDHEELIDVLRERGRTATALHRFAVAQVALAEAERRAGAGRMAASIHLDFADLRLAEGHPRRALVELQIADRMRPSDDVELEARIALSSARVLATIGRDARARDAAGRGLRALRSKPAPGHASLAAELQRMLEPGTGEPETTGTARPSG